MQETTASPPPVTWLYGGLGLLPFAAGAGGAWVEHGVTRSLVQLGLLVYGALILAFLGGGRWGLEIVRERVRPAVITGAMAGPILCTLLIAAITVAPAWRLLVLAVAHFVQWAWDVRSPETPRWYPRLRHVLAGGAIACLLLGAAASLSA